MVLNMAVKEIRASAAITHIESLSKEDTSNLMYMLASLKEDNVI